MFGKRRIVLLATLACVLGPMVAAPSSFGSIIKQEQGEEQEEDPGRGDDLARIRRWRSFLDRADRAFFAAHMNTEEVRAKISEAEERIEELEAAEKSREPDPGGRSDITGNVAFLERALRAFTAAHMNTADAQRWLDEAREKT